METSHQFVSVTWEETPLMCCGRRPDGLAAESGAQGSRPSRTRVSEGAVARETGAIKESFLLPMSSVPGGG